MLFFREDGKDCMKFYTDPGYFFELWFKEIQRDIDSKKAELRQKKKNRVCIILYVEAKNTISITKTRPCNIQIFLKL